MKWLSFIRRIVDPDRWEEMLSTLKRHKLRTGLTAFGVGWGMFMLVVLLGAGTGLQNGAEYQFRDDATNALWINDGETSIEYAGFPAGRDIQFTNAEYDAIVNELPGVETPTARYYSRLGNVVSRGNKSFGFRVRAVHPGHKYIENTVMIRGRYLNEIDISEKRKVAVIGREVRKFLYEEDEEPMGTMINVGGIPFQVVGVFSDSGGENEEKMIYLPISTVQLANQNSRNVHQIIFSTGDASLEETKVMEQKVRKLLADRLQFDPADEQAVYIRNNTESFLMFQGLFTGIQSFIWLVGLGTLLAGIVGVSNITMITVKERTREFGVRKAIGATPGEVIGMVLAESILVTAISGYLGMVMGLMLLEGVNALMGAAQGSQNSFFREPQVSIGVALSALAVLVFFGTLAGWIPARHAASIKPIEALRDE